jgi:cysteine desulfurase
MHANNEVGTIQDLPALVNLAHSAGARFHTDACQSFCKIPLNVATLPVDLVTINAHKVHGPKGVGALYVRPGLALAPLMHGGGHEDGRRSGTLNVPGIAGFGAAVAAFGTDDGARMAELTRHLLARLRRHHPDLRVHGEGPAGAGNILNIAKPGRSGKVLFMELDRRGVSVSSSSACHSTKLTPSHVLLAMGFDDTEADEGLRISIGRFTTQAQIDVFSEALLDILRAPAGPTD